MRDRALNLNIADLVLSLTVEAGVHVTGIAESFLADAPADVKVSVRLNRGVHRAEDWRPFTNGESFGWKAYQAADDDSFLVERLGGHVLVHSASRPGCDSVDVLLGAPSVEGSQADGWLEREFLLVEILPLPVVALLAGRKGLLLHSCAVSLAGEGILFSGVSGTGKSTMAELWRKFGPEGSAVIDDEHLLARQVSGTALIYGAPWSRGPRRATFSRTPLSAVFFLSHGGHNRCTELSPAEALADLLSQVFLPVWSRQQLELTMQTCECIVQQVECYRLEFVPDRRVVGFVQEVLGDAL